MKQTTKELAEKYRIQQEKAAKRQQKYREQKRENGYKNMTISVKEDTKNLIKILIEILEKNNDGKNNYEVVGNFLENLRNPPKTDTTQEIGSETPKSKPTRKRKIVAKD